MPGTIVYIALLALLTLLTLRKPHLAVVAILCMFGLDQLGQIYFPFLRANGTFTNLYILSLIIIALPFAFLSGRFSMRFNYQHGKVRFFSIALFLYALISLAWAPGEASSRWMTAWPYLVVNVALAPMLIGRINDLEQVQKLFIWLGGALVLFLAIVPEWGARSLIIAGSRDEMGVPLALAQLSGYLLIIGAIHFKRHYLNTIWLAAVVTGALVVAIKSGSRGQLIFSIVSLILVIPIVWNRFTVKNALQLVATGAVIAAVGFYLFVAMEAYSYRWGINEMLVDFGERYDMAQSLLSEWLGSPQAIIFGLGNSASFSTGLLGIYPHIVPLEILGEEGVIGFFLFVVVVAFSLVQARHFSGLGGLPKNVKKVYAANIGCFIFTLLLSMKQGSLITSSEIFLFAVIGEKYLYLVKSGLYRSKQRLRVKMEAVT